MNNQGDSNRYQTIVIGGGQAGLSVGYYLAKRGVSFVILDANQRVGDAWRHRWDSLRRFTPARYAGLPGYPFPGRGDAFPTKQQMADYLESYAQRFQLPVRNRVRVDRLSRDGDKFIVSAGGQELEADNVVVAMSNYQSPSIPSFARDLDHGIVQWHSHCYRNPSQLREGGTLVVGVGNSGADIAMEVSRTQPTWIAGKESGHVPFDIESWIARFLLVRLVRFVGQHVLTLSTPIGRRLRPKLMSQASPLVRVKPQDLIAAGVERVPRVVGVRNGKPFLSDDRELDVKNVIWCTGYKSGFSWIDLPVFDKDGKPLHQRGIVTGMPGMDFVGLHFLYSMSSATLIGVGRDAERIAKAVEMRTGEARRAPNVGYWEHGARLGKQVGRVAN
jgi:putative flavoprotein involved in K+ transport